VLVASHISSLVTLTRNVTGPAPFAVKPIIEFVLDVKIEPFSISQ
jgi:hypothetical protein